MPVRRSPHFSSEAVLQDHFHQMGYYLVEGDGLQGTVIPFDSKQSNMNHLM
jgi:hypothetical protein